MEHMTPGLAIACYSFAAVCTAVVLCTVYAFAEPESCGRLVRAVRWRGVSVRGSEATVRRLGRESTVIARLSDLRLHRPGASPCGRAVEVVRSEGCGAELEALASREDATGVRVNGRKTWLDGARGTCLVTDQQSAPGVEAARTDQTGSTRRDISCCAGAAQSRVEGTGPRRGAGPVYAAKRVTAKPGHPSLLTARPHESEGGRR
jgi:hypothetical protein